MITNIIKKSKNHDIVGALGYVLTYHKAPEKVPVCPLDELEIQ